MHEAEVAQVRLVIIDPGTGRVLLMDGALPGVAVGEELQAGGALGRDLFVARTLQHAADDSRIVAAYDWSPPDAALPSEARWLPVGEAARVTGLGELLVLWVRQLSREQEGGLRPWARVAWLPDALAWVDEVLGPLSRRRLRGFTQLKQWGLAAVLRVPTDSGDVVVKHPSPVLAIEGPTVACLDDVVAGHVPRVLGCDPRTGRFVMQAFEADDQPAGPEAFSALARLQQTAAVAVDDLLGVGVPDRGLERLLPAVDQLAARRDLLFSACDLAPTDVRRPARSLGLVDVELLQAAGPTLSGRLAALQALGIPSSIVHGDFHTGNVSRREGEYVIFDWSHASLSHPWMDPPRWLPWESDPKGCLAAYLAQWEHVAPVKKLASTWSAAEPLALLFHAVMHAHFADHDPTQQATWAAATQALVLRALELLGP